ncbi:hypothetical protein Bbelb_013390 [Branchiostoma belcheri]|nr:hypothetical protein Bbelb_013390 [Branchiostoma belcheri]
MKPCYNPYRHRLTSPDTRVKFSSRFLKPVNGESRSRSHKIREEVVLRTRVDEEPNKSPAFYAKLQDDRKQHDFSHSQPRVAGKLWRENKLQVRVRHPFLPPTVSTPESDVKTCERTDGCRSHHSRVTDD